MTKKGFDKLALGLWSWLVSFKAGNKCEICGGKKSLSAHHFWGRKNKSTRYYVKNGVLLCYSCHVGQVKSAHESPAWFRDEMIKKRGDKWFDDLKLEWSKAVKWDEAYIKDVIINLEKEKNELTNLNR